MQLLTILKCIIQWHSACFQCHANIISAQFQNLWSPNRKSYPLRNHSLFLQFSQHPETTYPFSVSLHFGFAGVGYHYQVGSWVLESQDGCPRFRICLKGHPAEKCPSDCPVLCFHRGPGISLTRLTDYARFTCLSQNLSPLESQEVMLVDIS